MKRTGNRRYSSKMISDEFFMDLVGAALLAMVTVTVLVGFSMLLVWVLKSIAHLAGFLV